MVKTISKYFQDFPKTIPAPGGGNFLGLDYYFKTVGFLYFSHELNNEIRPSMNQIKSVAKTLRSDIDKHFKEQTLAVEWKKFFDDFDNTSLLLSDLSTFYEKFPDRLLEDKAFD